MPDGKWIAGLTPGMPVADAARVVLDARFGVVRHFLPLAAQKPDDDIEHVHQLRVGTRRATAALRVFADALPRKLLKATRRTLRTIRRAAGDARDWDVFIAALPDAKPLASANAKPALDFLMGYAFGQRDAAQVRLAQAAAEHASLFAEQSEELLARVREPQTENQPANFGALAVAQLGELFGTFTADVEANPTTPEAMHALRIAGKRLRYALEIFADCFPPAMKETIYPAVEGVQELLGDVQDANVGAERLVAIRATVEKVAPKELPRVRKGIDALAASMRKRVPAGAKAFARWRAAWLELMQGLKLEVALATTTT